MTENGFGISAENRELPTYRALSLHASTMLSCSHTLPTMIPAFIFCLVVTFGIYMLFYTVVAAFLCVPLSDAFLMGLNVAALILPVALEMIFLLPLLYGKLRMAGMISEGEKPLISAVFYYYTSPRRFLRAARISLGLFVSVLLVFCLPFLLVLGAALLVEVLPAFVGGLLLLLSLPLSLALLVFGVIFSVMSLSFVALAVGNEALPVRAAFFMALRGGRKNLKSNFGFLLHTLPRLLLSLATVGVLYVAWFSHYFAFTYLRYARALSLKEDSL